MSGDLAYKSILQSSALMKYIFETSAYPKEHEQLKLLRETTVQKCQENSEYIMNVPVDEAQFVSILLKIMNAKKTLEIGVFTGYSLLATALALPHDGKDKHEDSFDYVFVDADKAEYIKYHELVLKLVKKGGIIAYDNTLYFGTVAMPEEDVKWDILRQNRKPLIEFNNFIANDSRLESAIVSIGDGVTLCRRL
ncbi:hypothetical protein GLYMA_05G147000v4 [Glycine max]|uniref:flavonoid 3',5'-methyltransferase-like isoform X2 n=1 Tax=Glycine soja TaxID=3848 RepID=UPI00103BCAC1|nr:flavonoid 3',5'-methyltransferase-like isoform X2 [Glycine soja]KAG4391245.1 hypothetical protein GLYMA_05G147000v4 [Glycine max]